MVEQTTSTHLTKQTNSILEMFDSVHALYKNVDIDGSGELGIEVIGHAISITNDPFTTMLFFQVGVERTIVVQRYSYGTTGVETLVETKTFPVNDRPGMEDYIIATFTN